MKRLLVVGDSCTDVFVYCHAGRLAPDLPVPVLDVIEEICNPGMAANVARNIEALGHPCDLVTQDGWELMTKTRYVHGKTNHTFIRIDSKQPISRASVRDIPLAGYELIAISDYDKGFLTAEDIQYLCENHACVFIDSKKLLGAYLNGATCIKINNIEYERSKDRLTPELAEKTIITGGEEGARYRGVAYPVPDVVHVKDATGAGDSFFAALVVRYAETHDVPEAIRFANGCASRTVTQRGVTLVERP